MDVAPGASGDVRDGGALLDIPSQAAVHLELDPSRINVRARSFAAGSAGGQDQECCYLSKSLLLRLEGLLSETGVASGIDCRGKRTGTPSRS